MEKIHLFFHNGRYVCAFEKVASVSHAAQSLCDTFGYVPELLTVKAFDKEAYEKFMTDNAEFQIMFKDQKLIAQKTVTVKVPHMLKFEVYLPFEYYEEFYSINELTKAQENFDQFKIDGTLKHQIPDKKIGEVDGQDFEIVAELEGEDVSTL